MTTTTKQFELTGTTDYTPQGPNDIIPVNTFNAGKVNTSSLEDLTFSNPREEAVIEVEPGEKMLENFEIMLNQVNRELLETVRIVGKVKSEAEMVIDYHDDGLGDYRRHSDITIEAASGSKLTIYLLQRFSERTDSRMFVNVQCAADAEVRLIIADSGSKTHRLDLHADLQDRSIFDCQSIYFGRGEEKYDYNYNLVHHGVLCQSNLVVNGALMDKAKKIWRGTIDFKRGSSGSVGNESEYVTMLDDTVGNIAIPLLLCTEDNVVGNHAASSGRLDPDMVFYVMSRGFSEKEANKLIITSRFSHVLDLLPNAELKDAVLGDILQKLDEA